jgi:sugar O-acyltransferase (sialic acid O-acetyltransferase NeuD family)
MLKKNKSLIILGAGETASLAYEYFTHDSPYTVVAFTAERKFLTKKIIHGIPVVPFETITKRYPPKKYDMFIAVSSTKLNRVRARLYSLAKKKHYTLASYVSSHAFVWRTVRHGDNCFILENNVIQHGVLIGNDVTLWSGNHIGHQTHISDHVFISSHCVLSGYCTIGFYSFLGVNSTYNDHITVAPDCIIGSGSVVIRNTQKGNVYVGNPAKLLKKSTP